MYPQHVYAPRRWPWVVAGAGVVVALAAAAFLIWFFVIRDTGPSDTVHGPSQAPFTLHVPEGWSSVSSSDLASLPGNPLGVVKKDDGTGVVIVNSQPPTSASLSELSKTVEKQLKQRIPDFTLIKSQTAEIPAGRAISISYTREKKGTSNILVAVPSAGQIYTLNAVIRPGSSSTAKQVGQIINSFDT
jgi:hypothetical protein